METLELQPATRRAQWYAFDRLSDASIDQKVLRLFQSFSCCNESLEFLRKMNDIQQTAVTRFMVLQSRAPNAVHERLVANLGEDSLSHRSVKRWPALFKVVDEAIWMMPALVVH